MEMVEQKMKEIGQALNSESLKTILDAFDYDNKDDFYTAVGSGRVNLDNLKKIAKKSPAKNVIKYWELKLIGI